MSTSPTAEARRCTVIGLGNPIMSDDGLGLRALARLGEVWELPPSVELVDGGTWGMRLLPTIEDAERLLLIDAINIDAAAGTPVVLGRAQLPRYLAMKVSPHQVDLGDVLTLAQFRGTLPDETVAIGLQPQCTDMGDALSPALEHRLDELVGTVVRQLDAWGIACRPRVGRAEGACTR